MIICYKCKNMADEILDCRPYCNKHYLEQRVFYEDVDRKLDNVRNNLDKGIDYVEAWIDAFDPEHKSSYWIKTWKCPYCDAENKIEYTYDGVLKSVCKECGKNKNYKDYR